MQFNTSFTGRVIQVTEALDYGDAVSNQVIALADLFTAMGVKNTIYSKWFHADVAHHRNDIDELAPSERDIIIYHYYGFAEYTPQIVADQYCTKILLYHNITPHQFFDESSRTYQFCLKGRQQLKDLIQRFQFFWSDSHYNQSELTSLGAKSSACFVAPIIVPPFEQSGLISHREPGSWLFLGRVAPNKGQVELVKLFAEAHSKSPETAQKLYIVGGYDHDDPYFTSLLREADAHGIRDLIKLTGKVSDEERENIFSRAMVYVSLSAHEGFGVPLVEAPLRGVPVVALDGSAVGETMGNCIGLVRTHAELTNVIGRLMTDSEFRDQVVNEQKLNAARFSPESVERMVSRALRAVLPKRRQFKTVSVVVCTYNRKDYLERCLNYLRHQSCTDFEVIVVNGPSNDGTHKLLERYTGQIKIAQNPQRNLSKSRNLGIELADGDVIAFIDDDAIPFDDWISNILSEYNTRPLTTAGLGGPAYYAGSFWFQAQDNGINRFAEAKVNIDSDEIGKNGWFRYNTGTNATFSTQHLREVNGFDEQFDYYLDESELCFRLQKNNALIGYSSEVIVRHEFAQSHNRGGKYNYNWFTICKNTAYFVAAYSGWSDQVLRQKLNERIRKERIAPLDDAVQAGNLAALERDSYVAAMWEGVAQGLSDAQRYPKSRKLALAPDNFRPYASAPAYPRVAKDIKSLHICIVTKEFPPFTGNGGVGTLYYHLASELLLMGHRVSVITPSGEDNVHSQGRFNIYFSKMQPDAWVNGLDGGFTTNLMWSLSAFHALSKLHKEHPIDVVDSALWDTETLAISLVPSASRPPVVLRLVTPYPVSSRINGWSVPENVTALFVEAERTLLGRANAVIPISESIAKTVEKEHNVRRDIRWQMAHCGIAYWPFFDVEKGYSEFQEFEKVPREALESSKLVVFVGRLERRKGIDLLMQSAQRILAADPEARLLIAGRDPEGWVNRVDEFLSADAADRIHFLGEVSDATRDKLLARAHCLVFPSRYESFGLVPLEAFVHGTPVIASRSGAIPEVVTHDLCGLLFEAESADSLAECVIRTLSEAGLRERLSEGARAQIRRFSSRASAIRAIEVYADLIPS
ncbi:glycosyltransferase [Paraburkholderia sp. JPY303]|uniref:glycosyltransferase n=1 Tax=Paraburkholderia atlantica TaxID=2654982 RepID=UPI0015926926|nr:glycosyltransferase [Paraburkholderia atlantica]NUY35336.1 glycosyltransferase [Paraburkholderia atlantica]